MDVVIKEESIYIPDERVSGEKVQLSKTACAVQLIRNPNGAGLGPLRQLGVGTTVELCGDGYNDRTVKVRANGDCFFVFLEDLRSTPN